MADNSKNTFTVDLEIEGKVKRFKFVRYNEDDFPGKEEVKKHCVYIFSKFTRDKQWEHHHLSNTSDFSDVFPKKDAKEYFARFDANTIMVLDVDEANDLLPIENAVRQLFNIPYKYEK